METVLSIVAIVLSVASLTWQLVSHRLTGHRVFVRMGASIPVYGPLPHCRTVTAENRGRSAVTVNSIAIDVGNGQAAQVVLDLVPAMSDALPFRLEPGSSASWSYPITVDEQIGALHPHRRAMVTLGTGRRHYSKRT